MYVPVQIAIPCIESQRILAHPPSLCPVVPARRIVLQVRLNVELPPRPGIAAAEGGVRLAAEDVAEGVVVDRVLDDAAVVGHVADGALAVGQLPVGGAISGEPRQE